MGTSTHSRMRANSPRIVTARDAPKPSRVLLVDDHASLAEATAAFLGSFGLEVRIASSGQEALEAAPTFRPDIVISDLRLPDLSGLDLARALRALPETKNALLTISTAMSRTEVRSFESQPDAADIDLFFSKPLTEEVVNRLLGAIAARHGRGKPTVPDLTTERPRGSNKCLDSTN
jgi:CheY-like chemotaxis protein